MDCRKFKDEVYQLKNYKEIFSSFRLRESNCYDHYQKEKELAEPQYDEDDNASAISKKQFTIEWEYVAYETVIDLYNCLDREMNEDFKKKKKEWIGIEEPFADCYITFTELHEELDKIEDDVEFAYAVFCIIKSLYYKEKIYIKYACKLYENIRELGLGTYVELADRLNDKKVFIAMSFDKDMDEVREAIREAVTASGYRPVWMDEKQHNGQIVERIYKEIDESQFVVVDLTQQKTGVYYEAGYAMGAKKPLIFCCEDADKENRHFDVAQINTILWKDEDDLKNRLMERIAVTINNGK